MIEYEEDWLVQVFLLYDGGVAVRSSMFAIPSALFAVLLLYLDEWYPGLRDDLGLEDLGHSVIWNASISCLSILLGFRTGQGFSRFWEGTGLLHQMRGEWFDTVSNCVTFSISAKKRIPEQVVNFRHALVRLMSLCHGSALEEISEYSIQVETIDPMGLDPGTLIHLKECHENFGFNKVEVMLHLVQSLIVSSHDAGILNVPPPILSRVFQTISRGFVNLLNAKKITDTRFPFPYAQLISMLLFIHTLLTPLVITATVSSKVLAAILCFIPLFGMCALNFISSELENPFGTDANDLPLSHFQEEMNSCLMMLLHENTDMISGTSHRCITDFQELVDSMTPQEETDQDNGDDEDASAEKPVSRGALKRLSSFHDFLKEEEEEAERSRSLQSLELEMVAPVETPSVSQPIVVEAQKPLKYEIIEARLAALHPAYSDNMDKFLESIHMYSTCFEAHVTQMHETFASLRAVNALRGWEAAVHPSP